MWVDLGSGGGFPGLVIACALAGTTGRRWSIWSKATRKKAAFLREAAQVTGAPAVVHAVRIEDFVDNAAGSRSTWSPRGRLRPLDRAARSARIRC